MEPTRILVCEDDPDIARILESYLSGYGYDVSVVGGQADAEARLAEWTPDLILLDIMLPESNEAGWELLSKIRSESTVPVIMITALSRLDDRVRGLSEGADDFISKPFDLVEVKARIEAVLRRTHPGLREIGLEIDDERKEVRVRGQLVSLSPKEYGLLKLLASVPGRVFSSDEILEELWLKEKERDANGQEPQKVYANGQDVQKFVYLLRKRIEKDPKDPKIVLTVRGFGYRLAT